VRMTSGHSAEFEIDESTLGELREIVEATREFPGDATVRVLSHVEFNAKGTRLKVVRVLPAEVGEPETLTTAEGVEALKALGILPGGAQTNRAGRRGRKR
jgi:hypothetical protein